MDRRFFLSCLMVPVICLLCSGCRNDRTGSDTEAAKPEVDVLCIEPRRTVFTHETTGRIGAFRIAEVRPQISGIVRERLFTEGADVHEGDTLYLLEDSIYQAAWKSAEAAWKKAEANLKPLKQKRDRFKSLLATNSISQQEYDDADAAYLVALAECLNQKALVDEARIRCEYTRITAPISGRIGLSGVTQGALVTEYQTDMLTSIQQIDPVYVTITLAASDLIRIRRMVTEGLLDEGSFGALRVFFDDGTPCSSMGVIDFSDISVISGTGSVVLRATLENPDGLLLPNMVLRAELTLGTASRAVLIPQQAAQINPDGSASVYVLDENDTATLRTIVSAGSKDGFWYVTSGLKEGERIIVGGLRNVRPGTTVKVQDQGER